jgi:hypothetical protein
MNESDNLRLVPEAQGLRDTSIIGSDPKAVRTPATSLLQSGLLNSSTGSRGMANQMVITVVIEK